MTSEEKELAETISEMERLKVAKKEANADYKAQIDDLNERALRLAESIQSQST